jgi:hypothetical protein
MANNKQSGTAAVQIELSTPYPLCGEGYVLRFVTWVEAALRPTKGMFLTLPSDPPHRKWEVTQAYTIVNHMEGIESHWKVVQ